MANGAARAEREREARQSPTARAPAQADIVIGKDVLELLSSAMYIDPLTIYREYLQNAADAIDEARHTGLLAPAEPGRVAIDIDLAARSIRIRDNGIGLSGSTFVRRLTALGASAKRGGSARGFRGVGRLAGLAYAQQLVFRTRAIGEPFVSEMIWDCRALRAALRASSDSGVAELIHRIVSIDRLDTARFPNRFFEVELKGVVRLRSDKLMSSRAVADYLAQVAPVPFSGSFPFGAEITAALAPAVRLCNLNVDISGIDGPIVRPHRDGFMDDRRYIHLEKPELIRIPDVDGGLAAIVWLLHHPYEGAVPTEASIKGLRLRYGNIQVGDHSVLGDLFPEPRFNSWSIGEVHVIDKRIVPNARRDDFEQNAHYSNLINQLTPIARSIARRCRASSKKRQLLRDFEARKMAVREHLAILAQGGISNVGRSAQGIAIDQALTRMGKVGEASELAGERAAMAASIDELRREISAVGGASLDTALAHFSPERRAMYQHLFDLIYDCSTNRVAAKALVERILVKIQIASSGTSHSPGPAS